jgi:hypothetical protein
MPAPPVVVSKIDNKRTIAQSREIIITVNNTIAGKTMKYVGYNQGYYFPGSNISGWLEYSNVNSLRVWAGLNAFVPQTAVQIDPNVSSVEEFDKRKNELRQSPEENKYIKWNELLLRYDRPDSSSTNAMVFSYALSELKRLGIDVILQTGSTEFEDTWNNKWKQWQRHYALAYYSAKKGDVAMFAMQNEPNHRNSGPMKLEKWIMGMKIVSDAVHCAVEDVNKKYGKKLTPKFVGPVTAGNNPEWWAEVVKNIRTDYHGNIVTKDLLEIFSTHSYNSPAIGYESRIQNINKIIKDNHPAGQSLPIAYTEIGRWMNAYLIDKDETMDSPSLFTEWAGIYSNNMKNGGYGMWAFKFANTASGPYPRGIKSGHHFIWQGKRIVEDEYNNIAYRKPVVTSSGMAQAALITDGNKSDASGWISDTSDVVKWAEIDLGKIHTIGSAVIYTGSANGVYTSPDRSKNFQLQYLSGNTWANIPGMEEKDNKYAQVFEIFKRPVSTNKIRFSSTDKEKVAVREIKLFEENKGPQNSETSFNVSGIQRTGQVVRLFAKGFKEERPLLETNTSSTDTGLDAFTSYDQKTGNYYMWLVQRGLFDYKVKLDLKSLEVAAGTPIIAETVSPLYYGEVSNIIMLPDNKISEITLSAQSVTLLTIPKEKLIRTTITSSVDAVVTDNKNISQQNSLQNEMLVQLNAAQPDNKIAYTWFDLSETFPANAQRVILKVNGYTDKTNSPFRIHVYGIPGSKWDKTKINWKTAPLLDSKEALIKEVGQKAHVAGEIAFTNIRQDHMLDVTDLVKKHITNGMTFVFIRETRHPGDDEDKGKKVMISSGKSKDKPQLIFWNTNKKREQ